MQPSSLIVYVIQFTSTILTFTLHLYEPYLFLPLVAIRQPSPYLPLGTVGGIVVNAYDSNKTDYGCNAMYTSITPALFRNKFISNSEDFNVFIEHSVEVSELQYRSAPSDMLGWLEVKSFTPGTPQAVAADNLCASNPNARELYDTLGAFGRGYNGSGLRVFKSPCMIMPLLSQTGVDYFKVSTLLTAAGLKLDQKAESNDDATVRRQGLKLLIMVEYMNFAPLIGRTSTDAQPQGNKGDIATVTVKPTLTFTLTETFARP